VCDVIVLGVLMLLLFVTFDDGARHTLEYVLSAWYGHLAFYAKEWIYAVSADGANTLCTPSLEPRAGAAQGWVAFREFEAS
jgi:hypothetical protein